MEQRVLTGYPSIDKPWLKYHKKQPIREFNVNQTFVDLLKDVNKNNMNSVALNFMGLAGNIWTYRQLFSQANKLADAFVKRGIKQGDTVLISTVSGVDEALNLIALNQIGAISKWIDVTASGAELKEAIITDNCKIVICFCVVIPELVKIIDDTEVETVVFVEPSQFMHPWKTLLRSRKDFLRMRTLAKNQKKNPLPKIRGKSKYVPFSKFIADGNEKEIITREYEKDRPVLKIQSSGTTGKPKIIVHTDYSINSSIKKFTGTDLPLFTELVLLKTAPAWVGYGLINTLGVGLAYGMQVLMTPMLGENILFEFNDMYDVVFGVPLHYRYLNANIDKISDMSRPLALISGGDKISKSEIENFELNYRKKGCKASIINGAGNNEVLGAGVVNPVKANRPGSIGIPMYDECISIFEPDSCEELQMGQEGEICYCTESAFLYYDGNPELTEDVKKTHSDGTVWIHSKDLGYMDEDGFVYIKGRLSRVITVGAFKISASQIEDVIQGHNAVCECVVVAMPDKEDGEVPIAFIVLDKSVSHTESDCLEEIKVLCQQNLKKKAVPKQYHVLEEIPYTSNNKQDYRSLERIAMKMG